MEGKHTAAVVVWKAKGKIPQQAYSHTASVIISIRSMNVVTQNVATILLDGFGYLTHSRIAVLLVCFRDFLILLCFFLCSLCRLHGPLCVCVFECLCAVFFLSFCEISNVFSWSIIISVRHSKQKLYCRFIHCNKQNTKKKTGFHLTIDINRCCFTHSSMPQVDDVVFNFFFF